MLTLFILKSGDPNADHDRLVKSFSHMMPDRVFVGNIEEINKHRYRKKWYIVMYDNEVIDRDLMEALPVYLKHSDSDVVVLFKRNEQDEVTTAPRLFKAGVILKDDCLMPKEKTWKFDRALDGWIK